MTALGTGESYAYDANGNMTTRVEGGLTYTQTFDAENRLISVAVSGQTTQFIYDGDGNLVKKINPDGSKTLYIAGIYEVDKTSGGAVTGTRTYYPAAGAMRIGSTLYYVLKDHLGSASVVTNSSGTMVGEQRYYPFGETRFTSGTMYTDKLFTGQRAIAGLGIYNYGARFYSPYINRFLSADTIVPGYANPQNLNRYSYVRNNPLRYTDPTGHMLDDGCSMGCSYTPPPPTNYCTTHPNSCGGGGGGGSGGSGLGGSTPTPSTTPLPQPVTTPSPQGTPSPTTTTSSVVVNQQVSYTYSPWMEAPYGDDGLDIGFTINPLFFLSSGPLETNVNSGNQPLTVSLDADYIYIQETTTTTTTSTTTINDQYSNPLSTTTNVTTTSSVTGLYQQAQITILPMGWTFIETGGNMCGVMAPC